MVGTDSWSSTARRVTATTATIEDGTRLVTLGQAAMTATTRAPRRTVAAAVPHECPGDGPPGRREHRRPRPLCSPNRRGTCWSAMVTAIPTVKPSSTGHGTNWMSRPSPARPMTRTMTPAMMATLATAPTPSWATMGTSTTAMAPVGPDTWTDDPPNTAATMPATIAVTMPAVAPPPRRRRSPGREGRATTPTVSPASKSPRHERRRPL